MSTETFCHFIHLLQNYKKKKILQSLIYTFFHDLIHVYNPWAGTDSPLGDKNLMSTERPYHFTYLCQFKKISLKSDFIHFFFMI